MRRLLFVLLAVLALSAPPAAMAASWSARMSVPTHRPKAGKKWPLKIVVKNSHGRRLSGTVQYHFLLGKQVVATRDCHTGNYTAPCRFKHGVYRDVIKWPAAAEGQRLTFQAVVRTRLGTKKLDWWVKVRR